MAAFAGACKYPDHVICSDVCAAHPRFLNCLSEYKRKGRGKNARCNLGLHVQSMKRDDNARKSAGRSRWKDLKKSNTRSPREAKISGLRRV